MSIRELGFALLHGKEDATKLSMQRPLTGMDHLTKNNVINKHQYGFRPQYSCQSQLLSLTQGILKAMDNKKQVDLVLLDFCKAFNKVLYKRLLCKLKNYGIQDDLIKWIEQWLTKRIQRVILENHTFSEVPVKSGIPQGTVLGPLISIEYQRYRYKYFINH